MLYGVLTMGPSGTAVESTEMALLKTLPLAFGVLFVGACTAKAPGRADEQTELQREVITEITRICSLPQPERDAEIKRAGEESRVVVRCP